MQTDPEIKHILKNIRKSLKQIQFRILHSEEQQVSDFLHSERTTSGSTTEEIRCSTPFPGMADIYHDCIFAWSQLPESLQSEKDAKEILRLIVRMAKNFSLNYKNMTLERLLNNPPFLNGPKALTWSPLRCYFTSKYFKSLNNAGTAQAFMNKAFELDPNFVAPT